MMSLAPDELMQDTSQRPRLKRSTRIALVAVPVLLLGLVIATPKLIELYQDWTWDSAVDEMGDSGTYEDGVARFTSEDRQDCVLGDLEVSGPCRSKAEDVFRSDAQLTIEHIDAFLSRIGVDGGFEEFMAEAVEETVPFSSHEVEYEKTKVGDVRVTRALLRGRSGLDVRISRTD